MTTYMKLSQSMDLFCANRNLHEIGQLCTNVEQINSRSKAALYSLTEMKATCFVNRIMRGCGRCGEFTETASRAR